MNRLVGSVWPDSDDARGCTLQVREGSGQTLFPFYDIGLLVLSLWCHPNWRLPSRDSDLKRQEGFSGEVTEANRRQEIRPAFECFGILRRLTILLSQQI